jgi:hypothetical protein
MKVTYTGKLDTDLDKVRFEIGDVRIGRGPRIDGENFVDDEINAILATEGGWGRTAARLCEVLANEWASMSGISRQGGKAGALTNDIARAQMWRQRALDLRQLYGGGIGQVRSSSAVRVDKYSDDIASDEL